MREEWVSANDGKEHVCFNGITGSMFMAHVALFTY